MVSRFRWLSATIIAVAAAVAGTAVAGAAVAGTAVAGTAGAAAATATQPDSATPGWRIAAVYPEDSQVESIAAASAANAWTEEGCTRPCHTGRDGLTLRHWTGRQWQIVSAWPAHAVGGIGLLTIAPGAKARPWAVYSYQAYPRTAVAHWTGTAWSAPTLIGKKFGYTDGVAAGSSAVWLFGVTPAGRSAVLRYNGKSWVSAPAPGLAVSGVSAASPDDIWVIGSLTGAAKGTWPMAVSHWNGKKWATSLLPRVPVPAKSAVAPLSVVAGGPRDAYALGYLMGPDGSIIPNDGMVLYHWNGVTWSRLTIPYRESEEFSIASDGHGGIWSWLEVDPGHHDYLVHYRDGRWAEVTDPRPAGAFSVQTDGITAIPGTASVWASGWASVAIPVGGNPGGTWGLILKYGA